MRLHAVQPKLDVLQVLSQGAQLSKLHVLQVAFTGSTAVGKQILAEAAATMKHVSVECGGKSPLIICADANIDEVRHTVHRLTHDTVARQGKSMGTAMAMQ